MPSRVAVNLVFFISTLGCDGFSGGLDVSDGMLKIAVTVVPDQ